MRNSLSTLYVRNIPYHQYEDFNETVCYVLEKYKKGLPLLLKEDRDIENPYNLVFYAIFNNLKKVSSTEADRFKDYWICAAGNAVMSMHEKLLKKYCIEYKILWEDFLAVKEGGILN